jgi:hypothetical protein
MSVFGAHATFVRRLAVGAAAVILSMPAAARGQDKATLARCQAPYGTIAINEPTNETMMWLRNYQLGSPSSLLRVYAQESNCFIVVERGAGMRNMQEERALASLGELQSGQNVGKGQVIAADFMMTPAMQFSDNNAGGVGGGLGGLVGGRTGALLGAGGGLRFKEAVTSITVASTRTGVQVAAAEGKARHTDFNLGGLGIGGGVIAGAGGYTSTAEGKVIAKSLLDNYNAVVASVRSNPNLRPMAAERIAQVTSGESKAEGGLGSAANSGDLMVPKINGVKMMRTASDAAPVVTTLARDEEVVYLGEESAGFYKVQGANGEGWVKKTLMNVLRP